MTIAIVAEKPAVARDIAKVLGARQRGQGCLKGGGYVVTWAIGHLVALAEPQEMNPDWKYWRRERLPMIPNDWMLKVQKRTSSQFRAVKAIINDKSVTEIICATDAGREGELIFRYIYEKAKCKKPIKRLWISSLTSEAIKEGFSKLIPGEKYVPLSNAAKGRSRADWLVGMNLSRAYSITRGKGHSVGRVQTPTLAMLVERELQIKNFVVHDYLEIDAKFLRNDLYENEKVSNSKDQSTLADAVMHYRGTWFDSEMAEARAGKIKKDELAKAKRLETNDEKVTQILERVENNQAKIDSISAKTRKIQAPLLYDLTELQRHANRVYGYSAKLTLQIAQKLYEEKKLISYPRTDSRYLTADMESKLPKIVSAIITPYQKHLQEEVGKKPLGSRYINDKKVSDHHAIIPTNKNASRTNLDAQQSRIYDLICRRLIMAWMSPYITLNTEVITVVNSSANSESNKGEEIRDCFYSKGVAVKQFGWKALDIKTSGKNKNQKNAEDDLPSGLKKDQMQKVIEVELKKKQTKPPKRFTDASLLTAMERAGKTLDDKELSDAMKASGLGTPATRAQIIETLLLREFTKRSGKAFIATEKGIKLIGNVHESVKSPQMTGEWERKLKEIEQGKGDLETFMSEIERYVSEVVKLAFSPSSNRESRMVKGQSRNSTYTKTATRAVSNQANASAGFDYNAPPPIDDDDFYPDRRSRVAAKNKKTSKTQNTKTQSVKAKTVKTNPAKPATAKPKANKQKEAQQNFSLGKVTSATETKQIKAARLSFAKNGKLEELLKNTFGFAAFRPYQENVCNEVIKGCDSLLVMPTGAGKSLCYQLPGIARGGTTLVISPLIALMEDQVLKLQQVGFRAERIHSGRKRLESRQSCVSYLAGDLDFLFIAPERLSVKGFPEMLAKRKPNLIAIDEAHCISHWGHDFRPDYRLLKDRLPMFRPSPIIALTATATPMVQRDIIEQIGMKKESSFIHGFKRDNIAIEVVELPPAERPGAIFDLLKNDNMKPAIIYAPTRKKVEQLHEMLESDFVSAAYHAGMTAKNRDKVQGKFINGELDVIVATVAFGMGIDKADIRSVIHLALPGSLEGYYQEIGRAGRDGKPARAVLFQSFADRQLHLFFHEKSYPEESILKTVFKGLNKKEQSLDSLRDKSGLADDIFDVALEKLWMQQGVKISPEDTACLGKASWMKPYKVQCDYKLAQIDEIQRWANAYSCRMRSLVNYFGDKTSDDTDCGICDFCDPKKSMANRYRSPDKTESAMVQSILSTLKYVEALSTGKLFEQIKKNTNIERRDYELLLEAMSRAGLLKLIETSFLKGNRTIHYRNATISEKGLDYDDSEQSLISIVGYKSVGKKKTKKRSKKAGKKTKLISSADANQTVFAALKEWRTREAKKLGVPAFMVFSNKTMNQLASICPDSEETLLSVKGVGAAFITKFGTNVLRVIKLNK